MERADVEAEEVLKVLSFCISQIKWRLKNSSKRRLETDILALCSGMRPVVMVDYGGKMPELQRHLCAVLELIQKEGSATFKKLRVMVIEDMIYLINIGEFAEYVAWSLSSEVKLFFVDLEQDPPEMITKPGESLVAMQLLLIQKLFSSVFTVNGVNNDVLHFQTENDVATAKSAITEHDHAQFSLLIDMSVCMKDSKLTIPTLNGWLLGYPIVYIFGKDHISDAIYNLSTKSLHLFKILVYRNIAHANRTQTEELLSFSVPYDLSMEGSNEPWAEAFLLHMQAKWERCKQAWRSLQMEVTQCYPQAIAL
ncbi:hypothetical protein Nepgr_030448 [Nepenthes gracilis]|uniref:Uncharacterized protein n=1 Tax=Nepenthes gracilis TaxID=150966 RepID=A0AAD3Y5S1_NEPGR|nr:hypothetical protein Nepgr_030448 [Nepenthes gracilis]